MKKAKKISAPILALFLVLLVFVLAPLTTSAAAPTAVCTVAVTEQNVGTDDYYVSADVTFQSEYEFTAGLFTVDAPNLTLNGCTVKSSTGGDAPEVHYEAASNKVIFVGFSESTENDIRSYTSLTLNLKFTLSGEDTGFTRSVSVKNIAVANVDEVKFTVADAQGTLHTHTVGDTYEKDAEYHWKVCTSCSETVNKAAHTFSSVVTNPTCTAGGYTTYTCTVCGYSYTGDETEPTTHTLGEWLSDADNHWHVCTGCAAIVDSAAHTASDWITDKEATATEEGHRHKECTVCGRVLEEEDIETLSTHIPGDINNDGDVNNKDLTRLFQYLSEWEVVIY